MGGWVDVPDQAPHVPIVVSNRSASGGVNTFSSPLDIQMDQVVDLTNGYAPVPGVRKVRPGTSICASGPTFGPVLAMSEYTPSTFLSKLLIVTPSAAFPAAGHLKLWEWDGISPTFTLVATLSGMTSATLPVDIVTGVDLNVGQTPAVARIIQQDAPYDYVYAGAAASAVTGISAKPVAGFPLGIALDRGFLAGRIATARGKIFYSDVASWNYTGWSPTVQAFAMGGGTKQEVVALKSFRQDEMIAFFSDRIEALILDGDPFGVVAPSGAWGRVVIDTTIGCASRRSVATIGEDLFFVDQYGNVRSLARTITDNSQGTKTKPISYLIQSWIDRINPAAAATIQGAAFDRYYVISLPIDSAVTPSHTFIFDTINGAWFGPWIGTWSRVGSLAVATLNAAASSQDRNPTLYIGGAATGNAEVFRTFSGTSDDGAPIVFQETTKRETYPVPTAGGVLGGLEGRKKPLRERLYALPSAAQTMMVEARKDGGAWKLIGYAALTGDSPQLPLTGPIDFTGNGIVEKVMTLEDQFQNALDMQFRYTCTANGEVSILGHTEQVHLKNIDWTPTP